MYFNFFPQSYFKDNSIQFFENYRQSRRSKCMSNSLLYNEKQNLKEIKLKSNRKGNCRFCGRFFCGC